MAFVGISKDFMERVTSKIRKMRDAEFKSIGDTPIISISDNEPWALKVLWGEHLHLKDQMPDKWKSKFDTVRLRVKIPIGTDENKMWYEFHAKPVKHILAPPNTDWYASHIVDPTVEQIAPIVEYATKFKEIEARWKNVTEQVLSFLQSCKSANEAVKLWPDVKMYFDQHDINRLEIKNVRNNTTESEAAKKLAELDTTSLTSAAVIARMSGAQV